MNISPFGLYQLSTDYGRLYQLICQGHRIAAWADSFSLFDEEGNPLRDICEVRRHSEFVINISVRGNSYGCVYRSMANDYKESEAFEKVCRTCNLQWIDPGQGTAQD
jgi:hypothetical protein